MASRSKRDPYAYEREYNAFLRELRQFHDSRGTSFRHPPKLNGRYVDLYLLYSQVTAAGGWHKVNQSRRWDTVLNLLKVPQECPNASVAIKHIYMRYLDQYEKIHFHGEDPDDDVAELSDSRGRKTLNSLFPVAMVYNHQQHELSDVLRAQLGILQESPATTDYNKLVFSLLSGFPNEVDFAINVCMLLSNEGRHVLRLEKYPRLIELLVAHVGVFSDINSNLPGILEGSSLDVDATSKFWDDTLEDLEVRELLGPWRAGERDTSEEDYSLFNLSQSTGIRGREGQRVVQIASILRNVSFEEHNVAVMASSPVCLKFLLLCSHSRWSCLRQLGFDTLGNLCTEITLEPFDDLYTQLIYRTIIRNLLTDDRFLIIRGLEMLTGLCTVASNVYILVKTLDNRVYRKICSLLTIRDLMVLVYTLECLYHITELGSEPCNSISQIHSVFDTLVGLLTLEAQLYGSDSCVNMKLVNTPEPTATPAAPPPPQPSLKSVSYTHSHKSMSVPIPVGYQELDNEAFACSWLKATYEISPLRSVLQTEVYTDYQSSCIKLGKKGLVGPTQLSNYIRSVFPHVMPRKTEANSDLTIEGIKRRVHPLPVSIIAPVKSASISTPQKNSHTQTYGRCTSVPSSLSISSSPNRSVSPSSATSSKSHSPILKAQLSAPPRSPSTHSPLQQALTGINSSPPSSPGSASKDSSSLIKSLLANKVSQNIQRQQEMLKQHNSPTSPASEGAVLSPTASIALKARATSQLGAMLGHCDLPKKVAVAAVSTTVARTPPSASKRPVLLAPKSRINGIQRAVSSVACVNVIDSAKDGAGATKLHGVNADRAEKETGANIASPTKYHNSSYAEPAKGDRLTFKDKLKVEDASSNSKIQNGSQTCMSHASSFTSMPLNSPSIFKCLELAKTQNSELTLFSSVSQSVQQTQPPKRKGVLADLLDGKVTKDALFTMNGIVDKKLEKKIEPNIVNNVDKAVFATSKDVACDGKLVKHSSVVDSLQSIPTNGTPTKNCTLTNGENRNHGIHTIAAMKSPFVVAEKVAIRPSVITSTTTALPGTHPVAAVAAKVNQQPSSAPVLQVAAVITASTFENILSKYPNTTFSGCASDFSKFPVVKKDESDELIGFPRVSLEQLNQLRQKSKYQRIEPKRPLMESISAQSKAPKKIRLDDAIAALAPTTPPPTPDVPSPVIPVVSSASNCRELSSTVIKSGTVPVASSNSTMSKTSVAPPVTVNKVKTKLFVEATKVSNERRASGDKGSAMESPVLTKVQSQVTAAGGASKGAPVAASEGQTEQPAPAPPTKLEFVCDWKDCKAVFESSNAIFMHACKVHAPQGSANIPCMWENCDQMVRQRFSLMTHLQDRHCSESILKLEAMRRREISQSGKSNIPIQSTPPPHPGYAPNAALHAIKRHALEFLNPQDVSDEKEGPLTKSIRLTAALILRNLAINSPIGNRAVRQFETYLATIALSNMESSRSIAHFLGMLADDGEHAGPS